MPLEVREHWLAQVEEDIIDPRQKIIDPHHHFFRAGRCVSHIRPKRSMARYGHPWGAKNGIYAVLGRLSRGRPKTLAMRW